jgi:hypothetical protein
MIDLVYLQIGRKAFGLLVPNFEQTEFSRRRRL